MSSFTVSGRPASACRKASSLTTMSSVQPSRRSATTRVAASPPDSISRSSEETIFVVSASPEAGVFSADFRWVTVMVSW